MRTFLTRQWLGAVVAVVVAVCVCALLGNWQYQRYVGKSERAEVISRNYTAKPVPVGSVLPQRNRVLTDKQVWQRVTLQGHYCASPGCVLYVRNRPQDGEVGFYQLVPFVTRSGTMLVNRGFVPANARLSIPAREPAIPSGEIELTGRLRRIEPELSERTNPPGQVQSIAPGEVAQSLPADTQNLYTGAYLDMSEESSPAPNPPRPVPKPDTSLGPHLSYAFQWWIFGLFFPGALIYAGRRTLQEQSAAPATPRPKPRSQRRRDEDEEDAILDR
ncbi:SURF1 family protein [Dermabacteraceae bacterium TAE3-ERU27]|nr:SURF1 family protein [Dermabacteraceae bacterium TAE3-ERU27]